MSTITQFFIHRRLVLRRVGQLLVAGALLATVIAVLVKVETRQWQWDRLTSYWIASILLAALVVVLLRWEIKAVKEEHHLTILPPGFGTLRSRKLQGEGRFLSLLELATIFRWRPGGILLGRPIRPHRLFGLFNSIRVGPQDDRHMMTIAGTRSGKGTAALIPNLLLYPGSALVIDPKGELAQITAARRGHGGGRVTAGLAQDVYVIDPEGIVQGSQTAHWNPLAELDINSDTLLDMIDVIAWAIAPAQASGDASTNYFIAQARQLFIALVVHVLEVEPSSKQNLIFVRELIAQGDLELFEQLELEAQATGTHNPHEDPFAALLEFMASGSGYASAAGAKAAGTARRLINMAPDERSGVVNQLSELTNLLDKTSMERVLKESDFKLADLKLKPTTIYVCLSGTSMSTDSSKLLTIIVAMSLKAMEQTPKKANHAVLFAMDEFYALGYLKPLDTGIGLIAGYGIKLWPVLQHLSQLKRLYPAVWQNFLANCGALQLFGDLDAETIEYLVAQRIGETVHTQADGSVVRRPLLTANELASNFFTRESRRELVLFNQQPAAVLELLDYYRFFPASLYNDDPRNSTAP